MRNHSDLPHDHAARTGRQNRSRPANTSSPQPTPTYQAVTSWNGNAWLIRLQTPNGRDVATTQTPRLNLVGPAARLLAHNVNPEGIEPQLTVEIDGDVQFQLRLAEGLVRDAATEVQRAITSLSHINMSPQDIVTILACHRLSAEPRRPLVVSNTEIATNGLAHHPAVLAVLWEDTTRPQDIVVAQATYCRDCIDQDRQPWRQAPHASSALLYHAPIHCDRCRRQHLAATDLDGSAR